MAASGPPPPTAITERVIIPVKGGVEDWKESYKQLLLTLKEQPGYIRTRWGPRSEDPQTLDLMIGKSIEQETHIRAIANPRRLGVSRSQKCLRGKRRSFQVHGTDGSGPQRQALGLYYQV